MSGLAELLLSKGAIVSGSDSKPSPLTEKLTGLGAVIGYPQKAENIPEHTDLVVATAAIHPDNPEIKETERRALPLLTRAELLGQVMRQYELPIAIAGTHGKTTTTSMISEILLRTGADPTISVGGNLASIGGNFLVGGGRYFVMEACEYTNSFLSFFPKIAVILNIDADHLDFFKDIDDIRQSFRRFALLLPADGTLVVNRDIEGFEDLVKDLPCRIITFGRHEASDYRPDDIHFDEYAHPSFSVTGNGTKRQFTLGVPGEHNVYNATAAIAVADLLGFGSSELLPEALSGYAGTDRRFELKGTVNGITVIDDYAHHPTEIRATLKAAANYPHKKLWCVFQPHTYSRTKALFDEFADALCLADEVVLADIYAARETDDLGISSSMLSDEINARGGSSRYLSSFSEIENFLLANCVNGDLLITMGAGNIVTVGEELLKNK